MSPELWLAASLLATASLIPHGPTNAMALALVASLYPIGMT